MDAATTVSAVVVANAAVVVTVVVGVVVADPVVDVVAVRVVVFCIPCYGCCPLPEINHYNVAVFSWFVRVH